MCIGHIFIMSEKIRFTTYIPAMSCQRRFCKFYSHHFVNTCTLYYFKTTDGNMEGRNFCHQHWNPSSYLSYEECHPDCHGGRYGSFTISDVYFIHGSRKESLILVFLLVPLRLYFLESRLHPAGYLHPVHFSTWVYTHIY